MSDPRDSVTRSAKPELHKTHVAEPHHHAPLPKSVTHSAVPQQDKSVVAHLLGAANLLTAIQTQTSAMVQKASRTEDSIEIGKELLEQCHAAAAELTAAWQAVPFTPQHDTAHADGQDPVHEKRNVSPPLRKAMTQVRDQLAAVVADINFLTKLESQSVRKPTPGPISDYYNLTGPMIGAFNHVCGILGFEKTGFDALAKRAAITVWASPEKVDSCLCS